jgi:hypothetical protein
MKTEQEQIEKMARSMCGYCSTDGRCAVSKNGRETDICANVDTEHCLYKEYAEMLIESGYGDVSEYKAEIERLKDEIIYLERKIAIRDNALKDRDKAIEMLEGKQDTIVKQAKIDVLNELKTRHDYAIKNMGYPWDITQQIDKLIEEVKNDECNC